MVVRHCDQTWEIAKRDPISWGSKKKKKKMLTRLTICSHIPLSPQRGQCAAFLDLNLKWAFASFVYFFKRNLVTYFSWFWQQIILDTQWFCRHTFLMAVMLTSGSIFCIFGQFSRLFPRFIFKTPWGTQKNSGFCKNFDIDFLFSTVYSKWEGEDTFSGPHNVFQFLACSADELFALRALGFGDTWNGVIGVFQMNYAGNTVIHG